MGSILLDKTIKCEDSGIMLHWPCHCGAYARACGSCGYIRTFAGLIKKDDPEKLEHYAAIRYLTTYEKAADMFSSETENWTAGGSLRWLIFDNKGVAPENLAGMIAIMAVRETRKTGMIKAAYWVAKRFGRRGIAPAALNAVTENAFENGYKSVCLEIYTNNPWSLRVAEKAGFTAVEQNEWMVSAYKLKKFGGANR
ncbi:MAG: GNAT family N-acetyltransferase [Alphaproteobacteria bacterium]|nr:GNAT family N-acetyltransferase [Alphaproteobacteria bacterium]